MSILFLILSQEFPEPIGFLNDYANVLNRRQVEDLENQLKEIENKTSVEIAIAIFDSIGYSIEEYANLLFERWGIGKKGKDNGILILISMKERRVRIEVGYGLEEVITDGIAGDIIRNKIAPYFREGNYYLGLKSALNEIENRISEGSNTEEREGNFLDLFSILVFFIAFALLIFFGIHPIFVIFVNLVIIILFVYYFNFNFLVLFPLVLGVILVIIHPFLLFPIFFIFIIYILGHSTSDPINILVPFMELFVIFLFVHSLAKMGYYKRRGINIEVIEGGPRWSYGGVGFGGGSSGGGFGGGSSGGGGASGGW
ncbi:MAG: TPM domain-containing protein [candidate division WOR-3 bacterium]